jgi:hypothetical protein
MNKISIGSSRGRIRHVDIIPLSVINGRIFIGEQAHDKITKLSIEEFTEENSSCGVNVSIRKPVPLVEKFSYCNYSLSIYF